MGFGMQRWITSMPTRKFFGKGNNNRSEHTENIAGHDIKEMYHLEPNNLENLLHKKYSPGYEKVLKKGLENESQKQKLHGWLILIISLAIIVSLIFYLSDLLNLF